MSDIPFKRVNLGDVHSELDPVLDSGMIGLGEKVFEFERELADYLGVSHVVAVDSCTSALFLSLKADERKEVGVPSMTVPLVAGAALEAGKMLYLTDATEWVGSSYLIEGTTVWDSAHELERNQCHGISTAARICFSFYPTKNIGSADGGAIACNDPEFEKWVRMISTYGRNQEARYQNSWDYDTEVIGYKRHYTNVQAAICLAQLKRLDEVNRRRRRIVDIYNDAFGLENRSLYLYRISVPHRDEFIQRMKADGIECGVHFKPLHMMAAFRGFPFSGDKGRVEDVYAHTVSLPLYYGLTDDQVGQVISATMKFRDL
jgi:dTDP-4-amino-4,6-dideoxygalactose transaminase